MEYLDAFKFQEKCIEPMTQLEKVVFYAELPEWSSDVSAILSILKNESWFDRSDIRV